MEHIIVASENLKIHGVLFEPDQPKSPAVVICHGAFEHKENWFPYAERLKSEGLTTFVFDFAGHGDSEGVRGLVNLRVWAHNIRDVLSHLHTRGYDQFALVGWGVGGSAGLLTAAHDQRLSCAVVLSSPIYLLPSIPERVAYGLLAVVARGKKAITKSPLTLSRINELGEMRMALDREVNEGYFSDPKVRRNYQAIPIPDSLDSVWVDITRAVENVRIPVLVVQGSQDTIVSLDQSEKLHALLKGPKRLEIVEGSGHALHLDKGKDVVYTMIYRWIKKHRASAEI